MLLMYQHQIINEMTWQQKSNFIQKDPVTCARSFEHIVQLFFHDILRNDAMSFEEVDFIYRVEFLKNSTKFKFQKKRPHKDLIPSCISLW